MLTVSVPNIRVVTVLVILFSHLTHTFLHNLVYQICADPQGFALPFLQSKNLTLATDVALRWRHPLQNFAHIGVFEKALSCCSLCDNFIWTMPYIPCLRKARPQGGFIGSRRPVEPSHHPGQRLSPAHRVAHQGILQVFRGRFPRIRFPPRLPLNIQRPHNFVDVEIS